MASFAFALPILPGKEETDIKTFEQFTSGEDKEAFASWNRSHGLRRHATWHQDTPNGTLAIVLLEGDDIENALRGMATSQEPFDRRFRDFVKDVHGVDLAIDPPPGVTPVIDWKA